MSSAPPLDFVLFYVSDLPAASSYFTDKLGFARVAEQEGPGFHYLTSGKGVDFGLSQAGVETPAPGTVELYFKTAEIAALRATLTERGVEATSGGLSNGVHDGPQSARKFSVIASRNEAAHPGRVGVGGCRHERRTAGRWPAVRCP